MGTQPQHWRVWVPKSSRGKDGICQPWCPWFWFRTPRHKTLDLDLMVPFPFPSLSPLPYHGMVHFAPLSGHPQPCASGDLPVSGPGRLEPDAGASRTLSLWVSQAKGGNWSWTGAQRSWRGASGPGKVRSSTYEVGKSRWTRQNKQAEKSSMCLSPTGHSCGVAGVEGQKERKKELDLSFRLHENFKNYQLEAVLVTKSKQGKKIFFSLSMSNWKGLGTNIASRKGSGWERMKLISAWPYLVQFVSKMTIPT